MRHPFFCEIASNFDLTGVSNYNGQCRERYLRSGASSCALNIKTPRYSLAPYRENLRYPIRLFVDTNTHYDKIRSVF